MVKMLVCMLKANFTCVLLQFGAGRVGPGEELLQTKFDV